MKLFKVSLKNKYNKNLKYSVYVIDESKPLATDYVNRYKKDDFEIVNTITLGYELGSKLFMAGKEKVK